MVVELTGLRVLLGPKPATEWSNEEELRRVQLARPADSMTLCLSIRCRYIEVKIMCKIYTYTSRRGENRASVLSVFQTNVVFATAKLVVMS